LARHTSCSHTSCGGRSASAGDGRSRCTQGHRTRRVAHAPVRCPNEDHLHCRSSHPFVVNQPGYRFALVSRSSCRAHRATFATARSISSSDSTLRIPCSALIARMSLMNSCARRSYSLSLISSLPLRVVNHRIYRSAYVRQYSRCTSPGRAKLQIRNTHTARNRLRPLATRVHALRVTSSASSTSIVHRGSLIVFLSRPHHRVSGHLAGAR
jgi:ribosomal protein S14